jgi:1-phosphatidylinositol-4-phosphate 5-kinase
MYRLLRGNTMDNVMVVRRKVSIIPSSSRLGGTALALFISFSCLVFSLVLSYVVLSCLLLSCGCVVLSCLIMSCLVLSGLVLSCLVWPCFVLQRYSFMCLIRQVFFENAVTTTAFTLYWTVTWVLYVCYLHYPVAQANDGSTPDVETPLSIAFLFVLGMKGFVDFFLWFAINDIQLASKDRTRRLELQNIPFAQRSARRSEPVKKDDFSPQFNNALKKEVLYYTTSGLCHATQQQDELERVVTVTDTYLDLDGPLDGISVTSCGTRERTSLYDPDVRHLFIRPPSAGKEYDPSVPPVRTGSASSGCVEFEVYRPCLFSKVRKLYGITAEMFVHSFAGEMAKLSLSDGGSSGAFMFFSGDMQYIVKSMSTKERKFLNEICDTYYEYLKKHPSSFVTRFYGLYSIKLYKSTYSFVVMGNTFAQNSKLPDEVIYRMYDLKGYNS